MANREENLKKINDELEQLNDAELEKVAGGTCVESARDSRVLNDLLAGTKYHQCGHYSAIRLFFEPNALGDIQAAWNSLGVDVELSNDGFTPNKYSLHGQTISQAEALKYAKNLVRPIYLDN